ncbi:MAG: BACON domain-containing protein [Clostridium sp.]|nr:BACON domain-containing protein [Clostridium sp.]
MKSILANHIVHAAVLTALTAGLYGCGSVTSEDDPFPDPLYVVESEFEFGSQGGYKLMHIVSDNIAWRVDCSTPWIAVSPDRGGISEVVRITVAGNPGPGARTDTIRVVSTTSSWPGGYDIVVRQSAP